MEFVRVIFTIFETLTIVIITIDYILITKKIHEEERIKSNNINERYGKIEGEIIEIVKCPEWSSLTKFKINSKVVIKKYKNGEALKREVLINIYEESYLEVGQYVEEYNGILRVVG